MAGDEADDQDAGSPSHADNDSGSDRDVADSAATEDVPRPIRLACLLLAAESLGLVVAAGFLVVDTVVGDPESVGRALLGAVLALAGALALAAGARGLLRLHVAARTPIVVLQLLAIPVSYSLAFQSDRVGYGGPILIAALATLYLLFTPPARAALDRDVTL